MWCVCVYHIPASKKLIIFGLFLQWIFFLLFFDFSKIFSHTSNQSNSSISLNQSINRSIDRIDFFPNDKSIIITCFLRKKRKFFLISTTTTCWFENLLDFRSEKKTYFSNQSINGWSFCLIEIYIYFHFCIISFSLVML